MYGLKKQDESVKHLFVTSKILTVYALYILEIILYVKKHKSDHSVDKVHPYNTRINRPVESHNLEFFKKKTTFMGTKFIYHLPRSIRSENNPVKLKTKIKQYLVELAPYSLNEFFQSSP